MPLETFEIELRNSHRSYFAGQVVSGVVNLVLTDKPKLIHGIKLKLQGKAKTHWKESSGRSTSHFSEEETYIDEKVYLLGYDPNMPDMTLDPGTHKFVFTFTLPSSLPSSLRHKYGQVKYQLEATITRNRKSNYTSKMPFTVNGILDLNLESEAKLEGETSNEKTVCCFCCASGPLGFNFKVPKKGFVPGERVPFHFNMFNHSNRVVNLTSVAVIQELKFIADLDHSKTKSVQICNIEGPKVQIGETMDWIVSSDVSTLKIPSVPPSRLDGCRIISISYFLKVKMDVKDASTLKEYVPIIIGTIPLRDDFDQISRSEIQMANTPTSDLGLDPGQVQLSIPNYPDLPPPSYEEAMNATKPEDDDNSSTTDPPDYGSIDCKSFVPKYVSYSFANK